MSTTNSISTSKNRIEWIDIAKAFGIILVIVGHTVGYRTHIQNIIFSFHMPLFIILSGYTFSENNSPKDILGKTWLDIKRLIGPTLLTILIGILLTLISWKTFDISTIIDVMVSNAKALFWASGVPVYNSPNIGALWFLISLFWARLIARFVTAFFSYENAIILLCGMGLIGVLLGGRLCLPQNFDVTFAMLFFFAIGMLWKKYQEIISKYSILILLVSMVIYSYLLLQDVYLEMAARSYPLGLVSFVEAICGTFICCKMAEVASNIKFINKIFAYIGNGTLLILCIHHLDSYLGFLWLTDNTYITCLLRTVVVVIIFLVISLIKKLVQKIDKIKKQKVN